MNQEELFFNCVGVVGVGLIGASFALAMRERRLAREIWGYSATGRSARKALELGIIDRQCKTLSELARNCDFILVSTPVLSIPPILKSLSLEVGKDTIVTDGGSVKSFVKECSSLFKFNNFIGSHPIAGTEKSGPEAGFSSLFDGSVCIVTPLEESDLNKYNTVCRVWESLGMNIVSMAPEAHDIVMAEVSHMPHAIAFSIVYAVKDKYYDGKRVTDFAGGGFKDFTRIAKSDATMWADIFLSNSKNILSSIEDFKEALNCLSQVIEKGDRKGIEDFILTARDVLLKNGKK